METRGDTLQGSTGGRHGYARRLRTGAASLIVIGGAIFTGGAVSLVTASAHSGAVATSETCVTWSASVTLNHNVTADRWVGVISTIPGSPGFAPKQGYDTSFGLIWSASGAAPKSGLVTLNIYLNNNGVPGTLESTASASLTPPTNCASPTIATTASAGGTVGTHVHDTATLSGGNNPTGSIVFTLFPDTASCNAGTGAVFTSTNPLTTSAPFTATSGSFTSTAIGTYQWLASYAGDPKNNPVNSICGSEPVTITKVVPAIGTTASAGGALGTAVHDTATVTGGTHPSGTVTFKLYSSLASCNTGGTPVFTAPNRPLATTPPLTAMSGNFTPTTPGTYEWVARYNGDAINMSMVTKCGDEPVTITTAAPSITTSASAGGVVGTGVHDTAVVAGGSNPTGTVTFTLYPDTASCTAGTGVLFTSTNPLTSSAPFTATSGTFAPATVGTYQWRATYSGDANNAGASSICGSEPEGILAASPSITTSASAGGVVPVTVSDTATVSGGFSPTGTVTFTLYASAASCSAGTGALFTSAAIALSGGSAASGTFSLTTAGTFQWIAHYSGDANNAAVSSTCGAEPVTTTGGPGGVLSITTPSTGSSEALTGITAGGFLLLAGLGMALAGALVPRRRI